MVLLIYYCDTKLIAAGPTRKMMQYVPSDSGRRSLWQKNGTLLIGLYSATRLDDSS